jgi:hypothetical protein
MCQQQAGIIVQFATGEGFCPFHHFLRRLRNRTPFYRLACKAHYPLELKELIAAPRFRQAVGDQKHGITGLVNAILWIVIGSLTGVDYNLLPQ